MPIDFVADTPAAKIDFTPDEVDLGSFATAPDVTIVSSPLTGGAPPLPRSSIISDITPPVGSAASDQPNPDVPAVEIGSGKPIELPRFGKQGTMLRGASEVGSGLVEWALNKPEELLASMYPPTSAAVLARYAPGMAQQFAGDVIKGVQGDKEALGRAGAMAALVGLPMGAKEFGKAKAAAEQAKAEMFSADEAARKALDTREAPGLVVDPTNKPPIDFVPDAESAPRDTSPKATEIPAPPAAEVLPLAAKTAEALGVTEPKGQAEPSGTLESLKTRRLEVLSDLSDYESPMTAEEAQREGHPELEGQTPWSSEPMAYRLKQELAHLNGKISDIEKPWESPKAKVDFTPDEPGASASVPLMVTKEMEQGLADLGYDRAARNKLTPEEAQSILSRQESSGGKEVPAAADETSSPAGQVEPAGVPARNWDAFYEDLVGDLDSFAPARTTGKRNYAMDDVAERFVENAKNATPGKPLDQVVSDFAKMDEATPSQIKKLRASVKNLVAKESPVTAETRPESGISVGPGAASPSDITQPGTVVSNMFAAIDRDRAEMGKPPMEPGEPRTWDQDQQIATARMNRDPQWIPDLIKEVLDKPRPLLSWENAGMVMQKAFWKSEANNALRRIANAVDSDLAPEELVRAKADAARFEDNLAQMEEAVGRGGTGSEAGRTLQSQKMGLTDDLSLIEMRLEMRGKKGGQPLTDAETAQINRIHKEYEEKVAALEKTASESDKRRVEAETRATLAEIGRQAAQERVPPPHIQKIVDKIGSTLHSRADAARERLKGKLFTLSPDVLKDLAEIGADNLFTIGYDLAKWSSKMIADIGEKVRPHLQAIWEASQKLMEDSVDVEAGSKKANARPDTRKTSATIKATIKKGDTPQQKRTKLLQRIEDRQAGGKGEPITPSVQAIARTFVEQGIHERETLIDAVHRVLEPIMEDWTRRKTMDAISGYGDYRTLSKDEISVKLRDLKGQMQQMAKLEDMAGGQAPLRSGVEQREVTKAQADLVKLVNEAKRKGGYETTDPTKQLRTALDEVKKRTQTAIEDYERRLREGDFTTRKLAPIKPDSELISAQADLKRVRKEWEQAKREKEMENRQGWQKALDKFVRWERAFKLSSPVVFGKLAAAALTRGVTTAVEEVSGGLHGLIPGVRKVAEQAPREGGLNVKAMAKAMTAAMTKGIRDAAQTARKGAADIDVTYGEKLVDKDWANVFGQLHGMLKAPVKRAEFTLSLEKRIAFNLKNGVDVSDPLVMTRIATEALNDGYRSIFMQRGFTSDMFNTFTGILEKSTKYPVAGEISARALRFLLPVVRVPANIIAETATGIYGAPLASARTMTAAIRGTLGNLDPVVADSIMRQLKKGSLGLGLIAVGFLNPQFVGGYDWKEKRKAGDVKTAGFQIGGHDVPRWMTHAPWFELMQFGATIRHVKDQHVKGGERGISEGAWAAGLGLIEETPLVNEMLHVNKVFDRNQRDQFFGEMLRSTLEPQAMVQTANLLDREDGETVKRKPSNLMEHLEMGIPGLRQNVPEKRRR